MNRQTIIFKISRGIMLMGVAVATVLGAASCKKSVIPAAKGDSVLFSAGLGGSESGTKTIYTDSNASDRRNAENINWLSGDQIRIWCKECSAPTVEGYGSADHWADYDVTPDETSQKKGKIVTHPGTVGLRWSEAETMPVHYFYAVSPSPRTSGKSGETGTLGTSGTPTPFTFTGIIPKEQTISGSLTSGTDPGDNTKTLTVATPDMNNLYMVAKKSVLPSPETKGDDDNAVFLDFLPVSTAIQFTIENAMTADGAKMQVESVKIISDPKTGTAKNISGAFETCLSDEWTTPTTISAPELSGIIGTYANDYPSCTEPAGATGQSSELTIDFTNTDACTTGIAKGDRLQFTFFLLPLSGPENVVDDLSFVITRKDGENGKKTIKTRLAMADGTGIPFPVHKKTYVTGILVPDSAQWTIQYTVDVTAWDDTHSEDIPFYYPDVQEITTVTSWEEVECNPGFEKQNN